MSSYIHFFIRSDNRMMPLLTRCRSSVIYQFFDSHAPYEKVAPLSKNGLESVFTGIYDVIDKINAQINELRANQALVAQFNNSVEEKMEEINSIKVDIADCEDSLAELRDAKSFVKLLLCIYEEAYDTKWEEEENRLDPEHYLYCGIDCGTPSISDVEKWEKSKIFKY